MGRSALGFKARTGRAILVVVSREGTRALEVVERTEVALLPPGEFAPYHAAEGLAPPQARAYVKPASNALAAWPRRPCARRPSAACALATRCAVARCWSAVAC